MPLYFLWLLTLYCPLNMIVVTQKMFWNSLILYTGCCYLRIDAVMEVQGEFRPYTSGGVYYSVAYIHLFSDKPFFFFFLNNGIMYITKFIILSISKCRSVALSILMWNHHCHPSPECSHFSIKQYLPVIPCPLLLVTTILSLYRFDYSRYLI